MLVLRRRRINTTFFRISDDTKLTFHTRLRQWSLADLADWRHRPRRKYLLHCHRNWIQRRGKWTHQPRICLPRPGGGMCLSSLWTFPDTDLLIRSRQLIKGHKNWNCNTLNCKQNHEMSVCLSPRSVLFRRQVSRSPQWPIHGLLAGKLVFITCWLLSGYYCWCSFTCAKKSKSKIPIELKFPRFVVSNNSPALKSLCTIPIGKSNKK